MNSSRLNVQSAEARLCRFFIPKDATKLRLAIGIAIRKDVKDTDVFVISGTLRSAVNPPSQLAVAAAIKESAK